MSSQSSSPGNDKMPAIKLPAGVEYKTVLQRLKSQGDKARAGHVLKNGYSLKRNKEMAIVAKIAKILRDLADDVSEDSTEPTLPPVIPTDTSSIIDDARAFEVDAKDLADNVTANLNKLMLHLGIEVGTTLTIPSDTAEIIVCTNVLNGWRVTTRSRISRTGAIQLMEVTSRAAAKDDTDGYSDYKRFSVADKLVKTGMPLTEKEVVSPGSTKPPQTSAIRGAKSATHVGTVRPKGAFCMFCKLHYKAVPIGAKSPLLLYAFLSRVHGKENEFLSPAKVAERNSDANKELTQQALLDSKERESFVLKTALPSLPAI